MEKKLNLRLNLKAKWYDLIESGIKKEEYREIKEYWHKRLTDDGVIKHFDSVTFVYGYTKRTMTFKVADIVIGGGKTEWGAIDGEKYFVIKLGERLQ